MAQRLENLRSIEDDALELMDKQGRGSISFCLATRASRSRTICRICAGTS